MSRWSLPSERAFFPGRPVATEAPRWAPPLGGERAFSPVPPRAMAAEERPPLAPAITSQGGLIQRRTGDGLVVLRATSLRHKKTVNTKVKVKKKTVDNVFAQLEKGTAAEELARHGKWVKLKLLSDKTKQGWASADDLAAQPGIVKSPDGDEDQASEPSKFIQVTDDPFSGGEPKPQDVSQGGLGDCWLLGTLSSFAASESGKELIKAMISPHTASDSYEVTLFKPLSRDSDEVRKITVRIDNWFPADDRDKLIYGQRKGGIWPLLIEKAVAESSLSYFKIEGGFTSNAMQALTGKRPKGLSFAGGRKGDLVVNKTKAKKTSTILRTIAEAKAEDRPVTVSIPRIKPRKFRETIHFNLSRSRTAKARGVPWYKGRSSRSIHEGTLEPLKYLSAAGRVTVSNDSTFVMEERKIEFIPPVATVRGEKTFALVKGRNDIEASYQSTQIESAKTALEGPHLYGVAGVNQAAKEVSLLDPRDTSRPRTKKMKTLRDVYDAKFYIASEA